MTSQEDPGEREPTCYDKPATAKRTDFWHQVRRTVGGEPVSDDQVNLLVEAAVRDLDLKPSDRLLDLCCGNGKLSDYLCKTCPVVKGVDRSEYLIGVAKEFFEREPDFTFHCHDIIEYLTTEDEPGRFNKASMFGSVQYLSNDILTEVLQLLRTRFNGVEIFLIADVPDKDEVRRFFKERYFAGIEDDPNLDLGMWRSQEDFAMLAEEAGWAASFQKKPENYFLTWYRYDVVLVPSRT